MGNQKNNTEPLKRTAKGEGYWNMKGAYQHEYELMWTNLVPPTGEAETTHGELLRTSAKLYYDYFNNGNMNACEIRSSWDDEDGEEERCISEYYQACLNYLRNTCRDDHELQGLLDRVEEIILTSDGRHYSDSDDHTYNLMVDHVIYWTLTHEDAPMNPTDKMKRY